MAKQKKKPTVSTSANRRVLRSKKTDAYYTLVYQQRKLARILRENGAAAAEAWADRFSSPSVLASVKNRLMHSLDKQKQRKEMRNKMLSVIKGIPSGRA